VIGFPIPDFLPQHEERKEEALRKDLGIHDDGSYGV
jgi:hypothetical protein